MNFLKEKVVHGSEGMISKYTLGFPNIISEKHS